MQENFAAGFQYAFEACTFTLYLQAVADSPLDYSGHATSNALKLEFLP